MPPSSFAPRKTEMAPVAFEYGEISLNAWLCGWNVDTGSTQDACHQMSKKMNSLYRATAQCWSATVPSSSIFLRIDARRSMMNQEFSGTRSDRLTFHPSLSEISPSGSL
jgi:hypothetical protein